MNIWGIRKKPMPNEYGDYAEPINFPMPNGPRWKKPKPFSGLILIGTITARCRRCATSTLIIAWEPGSFSVQDFINGVAFGRGVEQTLIDIAQRDPVYLYIVEKRHQFYMEVTERTLQAAKARLILFLCGDDFGATA